MSEQTPSWLLISVLFSSVPLSPAAAMTLYDAAVDLWRSDEGFRNVAGDLLNGRVVNLRKDMLLGTIAGPAFEAELDTERGSGKVRFLVARQGLDEAAAAAERPLAQMPVPKPQYLN